MTGLKRMKAKMASWFRGAVAGQRPVRVRQPPRRYSPDRAEEQKQKKERLSPRERRRTQSRAKF